MNVLGDFAGGPHCGCRQLPVRMLLGASLTPTIFVGELWS